MNHSALHPNPEPSPLEQMVRKRAKELGLTFQSLAKLAKMERSHLYKILAGQVEDPSVRLLCRLATALQVTPLQLFRFFMPQQPGSTNEINAVVTSLHLPQDKVSFTADVTVPDNSIMKAGEAFNKIWSIQNAGQTVWRNRRMIRTDQQMAVMHRDHDGRWQPLHSTSLLSLGDDIPLPIVEPGMSCLVEMTFRAPNENCSVASLWRMVDERGNYCFPPQFYLQVIVTVTGS